MTKHSGSRLMEQTYRVFVGLVSLGQLLSYKHYGLCFLKSRLVFFLDLTRGMLFFIQSTEIQRIVFRETVQRHKLHK